MLLDEPGQARRAPVRSLGAARRAPARWRGGRERPAKANGIRQTLRLRQDLLASAIAPDGRRRETFPFTSHPFVPALEDRRRRTRLVDNSRLAPGIEPCGRAISGRRPPASHWPKYSPDRCRVEQLLSAQHWLRRTPRPEHINDVCIALEPDPHDRSPIRMRIASLAPGTDQREFIQRSRDSGVRQKAL